MDQGPHEGLGHSTAHREQSVREQFIDKAFRADTLAIIDQANTIIAGYQAQGFTLTLRQLYYQFVARALIPNKQSEYKRLGSIIDDGRKAGLIDWSAIEDRTRELEKPSTWDSPESIISAVANQYKENPWDDQNHWPEVWIEKDALTGVIEPVCTRMRVPYFSCRGYVSSSEIYAGGKRLQQIARTGKTPIVFHLGDHDPSGLQMTEDVHDRLSMFARMGIAVDRLALNMNQVEQYNPPPNPAKETDARFANYEAEFGNESWELDALEPTVIDALIQDALDGIINKRQWDQSMRAERLNKAGLQAASNNWADVVEWMSEQGMT